jgi:hypothetical protein
MDDRIDRLLLIVEAQQRAITEQGKQIAVQGEHIGLLVQSVAMLLGEELGTPLSEAPEAERLDMDGKPY